MRGILFRGKDIYGKWLYGDLINLSKEIKQICNHSQLEHAHVVNPETVGQYTGLTDKNGTKIFEGDILEICKSSGRKYKVVVCWGNEWEKSAFVLYYGGTAWDYLKVLNDRFNEIKSYEVIGNTYDNPELLKEVIR